MNYEITTFLWNKNCFCTFYRPAYLYSSKSLRFAQPFTFVSMTFYCNGYIVDKLSAQYNIKMNLTAKNREPRRGCTAVVFESREMTANKWKPRVGGKRYSVTSCQWKLEVCAGSQRSAELVWKKTECNFFRQDPWIFWMNNFLRLFIIAI